MPRVFISYSRADAPFAHRLTASLREAGGDVWIDVADIRSGDDWSDSIQQALDECAIMLLVLSPEAMDSVNVASEWKYYLDEGKTVIPVLLRETKINFRLRPLNYIDFFRQDYEMALAQLRVELERHDVTFGSHGADAVGAPLPADEGGRSVRTLALGVAIAVLALAAVILAASTLLDFSGDSGKKSGEPSPEELAQTLVARRDATQTAAALVLENLLQNPSFETPYNAVESEAQTLHVADGWQPWYVLTDDNGHIVYAVPDYEPAPADRARSGNTAQSFGVDGLGFDGGAYQTVTVTPGTQLSFVAYFDKEPGTSGDVRVSVGIDPTGGTDATSAAVIWSVPDTVTDGYRALSVQATAQGAQVTVFVRGETAPASAETALVYVDDAVLTALGGS
jgi:hypothetical protein